MKKTVLRVLCCFLLTTMGGAKLSVVEAQEIVQLVVEMNDDTRQVYELADKPVVTFDGDSIAVVSDKVSAKYLRGDVKDFHFADGTVTGINSVANTNDIVFRYVDNENVVLAGKDLKGVALYNAGGKLVNRYSVSGGSVNISLNGLAHGVYMLQVPGRVTYKIIKK